jgi:hypothetical protein
MSNRGLQGCKPSVWLLELQSSVHSEIRTTHCLSWTRHKPGPPFLSSFTHSSEANLSSCSGSKTQLMLSLLPLIQDPSLQSHLNLESSYSSLRHTHILPPHGLKLTSLLLRSASLISLNFISSAFSASFLAFSKNNS